jgi:ERCC4-related helicase
MEVVWNRPTALIWLPRRNITVRVPQELLALFAVDDTRLLERLSFVSAAARIADSLSQDALVAPPGGTVIPLPHQLLAVRRAIAGDRIRFLLADEVGLGKTIEAGLIFRELKTRGLVRRILVVAPTGLVTQWVSEMKTHFNEDFRLVLPSRFAAWREASGVEDGGNLWRAHDQVVCPLDSVKPLESRRGWSHEQLARYNRERFEDLVSAGWDLIVIDEAHRLGGSSDQVARFKLGDALAQAAPYLLLLSATPHQGKSDSFRRLIAFLDPDAIPGDDPVSREIVAPYVIRTEKRHAIDAHGNALFTPRQTQLLRIAWDASHAEQRALYDAVTEYARTGYNRAMREKKAAIGFLMILMQRLITSSTAAIRAALERRLEVLGLPMGQLSLFPDEVTQEWATLDAQEQLDTVLATRLEGLHDERREVDLLLSAARRCEGRGPDVKAMALLDTMQRIQRDENDPALKILVFTEFIPTQAMLAEFLRQRGFEVISLNGSMTLDQRREAQRLFAVEAQVMISTDAGGEGLNLQFCHIVVNYDLPWNPMKIEQRIGRVDRIGQKTPVRAVNFALEDTVELRVREVLEEKLQRILEEFGVDKLADVLDSEEGGAPFEELFVQSVVSPKDAERKAIALAEEIRQKAEAARATAALLSSSERLDPREAQRIAEHQLPWWVERMTVGYLRAEERAGASAQRARTGYDLRWPDGHEVMSAVFNREEGDLAGVVHLSMEDERVRALTNQLPVFAPGQPIAVVVVPGISDKVSGIWSLWRVSLHAGGQRLDRFLPLFVADDGRALAPTARLLWDRLIDCGDDIRCAGPMTGDDALTAFMASRLVAEASGEIMFEELIAKQREGALRERRKGTFAFSARRRTVERIGLPQVRAKRLAQLADEERLWANRLAAREQTFPELEALVMVRVERENQAR